MFSRGVGACLGAIVLGALGASSIAQAQGVNTDEQARTHFRLGNVHYEAGEFVDAAREFQAAYELSHRPQLLYNIFVAERDAGNMGQAIQALREYLRLVPDADGHVQLEARLATLERQYAALGGHDPQTQTQTQTPTPTENQPPRQTHTDSQAVAPASSGGGGPWVPGFVIGGVGVAALITGVITGVLALDAKGQLSSMCDPDGGCNPGFEGTRDSAGLLAGLTDVLLISGLVVAAVGVTLAFLLADSGDRHSTAALACGPNGCLGQLRVPF